MLSCKAHGPRAHCICPCYVYVLWKGKQNREDSGYSQITYNLFVMDVTYQLIANLLLLLTEKVLILLLLSTELALNLLFVSPD